MTILLDTSVLIWTLSKDERLPQRVVDRLSGGHDAVAFSQVSLIELQIKMALGKLKTPLALDQIPEHAAKAGLHEVTLSNTAIFAVDRLPQLHRDPFDRLLIGHAMTLGAVLCTPDKTIHRYPLDTLW